MASFFLIHEKYKMAVVKHGCFLCSDSFLCDYLSLEDYFFFLSTWQRGSDGRVRTLPGLTHSASWPLSPHMGRGGPEGSLTCSAVYFRTHNPLPRVWPTSPICSHTPPLSNILYYANLCCVFGNLGFSFGLVAWQIIAEWLYLVFLEEKEKKKQV